MIRQALLLSALPEMADNTRPLRPTAIELSEAFSHPRSRATQTQHLRAVVAVAVVLASCSLIGQPAVAQPALKATLEQSTEWRAPDDTVTITLSRDLDVEEGRVAVVVGTLDLSDLVRVAGREVTYDPHVLPLPTGSNDLIVFVVKSGEWKEIGRSTLKVDRPSGLRSVENKFSADVQGIAQFETGGSPAEERPEAFENAGAQLGYAGKLQHRAFTLTGDVKVIATTEVEQALRFRDRGDRAERVDLASYRLRMERQQAFVELGHLRYGSHRHLISSFASRGLQMGARLGSRTDVRASLMNGSKIVGWDNTFGLADSSHQVMAGGVGFEVLADRPGGLRIDLDLLDGSRRPINGFNEGLITDREENQAWGARVAGSLPNGRLDVRAGFAESDFSNPFDELLSQGDDLVAVADEKRDSRYLEVDLGLLRERPMGSRFTSNIDLSVRHERVEPQYRTVGAFVAADIEQNGADLTLGLGPVQIVLGALESEDNLDDIPSILKTDTKIRNANLALPFNAFQAEPSLWLPVLTYSYNRTHQLAGEQPINSGFNATSHLPDQVSINHNVELDWQGNSWTFGYSFNDSDQDNRQPGRDLNDFLNTSHGLRFAWTPWATLDLGVDISRDRAVSVADDRADINRRLGLNWLWRIREDLSLSGLASWSEAEDDPATALSDSFVANLELAYRFAWREQQRHGGSGQFFLRYGTQDFESEDRVFGFFIARDEWTLNAGFNLSLR